MVASLHAGAAVAVLVAVGATLLAFRRSPGTALAVVVAAIAASNSSLLWLKHPFLTARWAALIVLAILLLPELRRTDAAARRGLALLAIVPGVCLLSAVWSVDPRLTVERTATFATVLWVAAAFALLWRREPDDLSSFVDAIAVLGAAVLALSLLAWPITDRAELSHQFRGLFENPNGLGLFLGLTFPFVAGALERRGRTWVQLVYLGLCVAIATEARARSGLVVLAVAGVGFTLSRGRRRHAAAAAAIAVAVVAGVSVALGGGGLGVPEAQQPSAPEAHGRRPAEQVATTAPHPSIISRATGARNEAWSVTVRLVKRKPVLGYGFGTGDRIFARHPDLVHFRGFEGNDPSNAYLRVLLELGVLALVIVLPLLGAAVLGARLLVAGRSIDGSCCGLVVISGLAAGAVESIFATAGAPWTPLIWTAAAGCVACAPAEWLRPGRGGG